MTETDIKSLIAEGEKLTVEFKGEEREAFNDRALYENVVCLANGEGGTLIIGVEDNGRVTGARPRHGNITEPTKLKAAIFNNTEQNTKCWCSTTSSASAAPAPEKRRS